MTGRQIKVSVSRLPEELIDRLDERIGLIWQEDDDNELFSDELMNTFNLLIIGYDSAWDEVERLTTENAEKDAAIKELQRKNEHLWNVTSSCTADNERLRRALEEAKGLIPLMQDDLESKSLRYNTGNMILHKINSALGEGDKE